MSFIANIIHDRQIYKHFHSWLSAVSNLRARKSNLWQNVRTRTISTAQTAEGSKPPAA